MTNPVCSCILLTISFKCNDGEKAVSRSFRELPDGARQCGRNVRHWPLSSRIETQVGSDGSPHRYQRGGIRPTGADAGSGYRNIPKRVVPRKFETLSSLAEGDEGAFCFFSGHRFMSRNEGSAASCTPAAETTVGQTGRAQYLRGDAARHRQIKGTEITKQFGGILFLWV